MYLVVYRYSERYEDDIQNLQYKQFETREQLEEFTKELADSNTNFLAFNTLSVLIMKG